MQTFHDWEPLSTSESDLNQLRQLAEEKQQNEDKDIEDCFERILHSTCTGFYSCTQMLCTFFT